MKRLQKISWQPPISKEVTSATWEGKVAKYPCCLQWVIWPHCLFTARQILVWMCTDRVSVLPWRSRKSRAKEEGGWFWLPNVVCWKRYPTNDLVPPHDSSSLQFLSFRLFAMFVVTHHENCQALHFLVSKKWHSSCLRRFNARFHQSHHQLITGQRIEYSDILPIIPDYHSWMMKHRMISSISWAEMGSRSKEMDQIPGFDWRF